jgi:hypothetical protein
MEVLTVAVFKMLHIDDNGMNRREKQCNTFSSGLEPGYVLTFNKHAPSGATLPIKASLPSLYYCPGYHSIYSLYAIQNGLSGKK